MQSGDARPARFHLVLVAAWSRPKVRQLRLRGSLSTKLTFGLATVSTRFPTAKGTIKVFHIRCETKLYSAARKVGVSLLASRFHTQEMNPTILLRACSLIASRRKQNIAIERIPCWCSVGNEPNNSLEEGWFLGHSLIRSINKEADLFSLEDHFPFPA